MVVLSGHLSTALKEARELLLVASPLPNEDVHNVHYAGVPPAEEAFINVGVHEEAWHAALGFASRTPVSPALRCVTFLTIFFFGTYLVAVCGRVFRLAVGDRSSASARRFEQRLTEVTESMTLAPMLCVLMISARLRALSLDPGSEPEFHVQVCMYVSTVAFFFRVLVGLLRPSNSNACLEAALVRTVKGEPGGSDHDNTDYQQLVVRGAYCVLSVLLYLTAFCILILGTCAEGDGTGREGDWLSGPPLSPMVRCIAAITATYMLEIALLEALSGVRQHFGASLLVEQQPDSPHLQRLPGWKQAPIALEETVSLRIPIMLCVLLVAIELRAVQLKLEPEAWMATAMYVTTASIALQALLTGATSTVQSAPKSKDASDDNGFVQHVTAILWGATLACLYIGTGAVLASVIVMEEQPLGLFVGAQAFLQKLHSLGISADEVMRKAPPLSTAMKCVMLLTVVYFIIYLCMILANAVQGTTRKWVHAVLRSAQQSLAFVPMLCIMMIAVRLRAMQLRVRDPQPWAQSTMYVATFAVITQAACSLCACSVSSDESDDEGFKDCNPAPENLLGKVAVIILLLLRYIASAILHVAVAALFVALVIMEPDLVNL